MNTITCYVLSGELLAYMFRPLGGHFQKSLKIHKSTIQISTSFLYIYIDIRVFGFTIDMSI
jgi:CRISPR/Cas system type I-B associated protein Csh2 (Cas7 group RAMP superfamily)